MCTYRHAYTKCVADKLLLFQATCQLLVYVAMVGLKPLHASLAARYLKLTQTQPLCPSHCASHLHTRECSPCVCSLYVPPLCVPTARARCVRSLCVCAPTVCAPHPPPHLQEAEGAVAGMMAGIMLMYIYGLVILTVLINMFTRLEQQQQIQRDLGEVALDGALGIILAPLWGVCCF